MQRQRRGDEGRLRGKGGGREGDLGWARVGTWEGPAGQPDSLGGLTGSVSHSCFCFLHGETSIEDR